jgi:FkbM family methyltransferase
MFRRLKRLFGGGGHAPSLGAMPRRLEESFAYLAMRSNPHFYAPTTYLGDYTVLGLLEGRLMMYLDTRGADIAPHIMTFGIWEPNYTRLFQRLIRPGDTVLDLGAHLGVYALLGAARTGPRGTVHAFEPNPRYARLLGQSLSVNGFSGFAKVHNVAVGAAEGTAELRWSWELGGGGHLSEKTGPLREGQRSTVARVVALDELFPDPAFTADVIKMDIEGTETRAVQGALKLLERSPRVRILFEFAPQMLAGHGSSPAELIGLLEGMRFRFWSVANDASLTPETAASLAARTDGLSNILASRQDPEAV